MKTLVACTVVATFTTLFTPVDVTAAPQGCNTAFDIGGSWAVNSTCDETDCGDGPAEMYAFGVLVTQTAASVTVTLPDGSPLVGLLCDDVLTVTGTYPDDGGMTTTTLTLTIAAKQQSFNGTSAWTWNGAGGPCTGACVLTGSKALVGANYCGPAAPNSSGAPGQITASGSVSVVENNLTLTAIQLPPGQFGYFLASETQGSFVPMGSQGTICVAGNIGRFNAASSIIQGPAGSLHVDLGSVPVNPPQAVLPGDTWNFQCCYRDVNPALTSNFTDAVSIPFI